MIDFAIARSCNFGKGAIPKTGLIGIAYCVLLQLQPGIQKRHIYSQ